MGGNKKVHHGESRKNTRYKIELERNGVNVSKAAREYFERVAREARSARALDEIAGLRGLSANWGLKPIRSLMPALMRA